jgi:hypothetical protein
MSRRLRTIGSQKARTSLLTANPATLGWSVPTLPFTGGLHATAYLGSGASCTVYATNKDSVVKIFKEQNEMDSELENLRIVGECPGLTGFVPTVKRFEGLVVEVVPIGRHYTDDLVVRASAEVGGSELPRRAIFGRKHILQLVEIVAVAPLVHRDLHPDNMYIKDDGSLLLNDWALAVKPGTRVSFAGVIEYVSFDVLAAQENKYEAKRIDDLHAVVRVAYRVLHAHDFKLIDPKSPYAFWKARLAGGQWAVAELAAASDDPIALKKAMVELMPW